ncbi:MAG TPA: site-2 protease family protein, partial [Burkholderiaceae bacterium]|nr:site-2 protease family protein [Burkholderiaceae bacterium]
MLPDYRLHPTVKLELTNNPNSAKRQYLLSTDGRQYYVDAAVGDIVVGLQASQGIEQIFEGLANKFSITRAAFDELLGVKLPAMGVLVPLQGGSGGRPAVTDPDAITFLFPLMPRLVAGRLASCAAVMFSAPAVGATLVLTLCVLVGAALMGSFTFVNLERLIHAPAGFTAAQYGQLYLVIFGVAVIHELGHLAAAKRFHCEIDRINVGAYLIFPVFYVNMSDTWKLSASQRIVVNLGGVYFQFIATMGLLLIAQFTASQLVMYAVYVSLYIILANLNPFLKFDGYWVYADYFDILNLRSQHLRLLGSLLRTAPTRWPALLGAAWKVNAGLAAYAVGATAFLAYFTGLLAVYLVEFVTLLPRKLTELGDAMVHSATFWAGVDVFAHVAYQLFLLF